MNRKEFKKRWLMGKIQPELFYVPFRSEEEYETLINPDVTIWLNGNVNSYVSCYLQINDWGECEIPYYILKTDKKENFNNVSITNCSSWERTSDTQIKIICSVYGSGESRYAQLGRTIIGGLKKGSYSIELFCDGYYQHDYKLYTNDQKSLSPTPIVENVKQMKKFRFMGKKITFSYPCTSIFFYYETECPQIGWSTFNGGGGTQTYTVRQTYAGTTNYTSTTDYTITYGSNVVGFSLYLSKNKMCDTYLAGPVTTGSKNEGVMSVQITDWCGMLPVQKSIAYHYDGDSGTSVTDYSFNSQLTIANNTVTDTQTYDGIRDDYDFAGHSVLGSTTSFQIGAYPHNGNEPTYSSVINKFTTDIDDYKLAATTTLAQDPEKCGIEGIRKRSFCYGQIDNCTLEQWCKLDWCLSSSGQVFQNALPIHYYSDYLDNGSLQKTKIQNGGTPYSTTEGLGYMISINANNVLDPIIEYLTAAQNLCKKSIYNLNLPNCTTDFNKMPLFRNTTKNTINLFKPYVFKLQDVCKDYDFNTFKEYWTNYVKTKYPSYTTFVWANKLFA